MYLLATFRWKSLTNKTAWTDSGSYIKLPHLVNPLRK